MPKTLRCQQIHHHNDDKNEDNDSVETEGLAVTFHKPKPFSKGKKAIHDEFEDEL
jgi:hypothetical protein